MAALTAPRTALSLQGNIKKIVYPLKAGVKAFENGLACIDSANLGSVAPGVSGSTTLKGIGLFTQTVDNSAGGSTVPVGVELQRERNILWFDSATGGGAVTIANLFQTLYINSDHEVLTTSSGNSVAGVMWALGGTFGGLGYPGAIGIELPF